MSAKAAQEGAWVKQSGPPPASEAVWASRECCTGCGGWGSVGGDQILAKITRKKSGVGRLVIRGSLGVFCG